MSKKEADKKGLVRYFAYGSNMNPARMRERGAVFYSRERLTLHGWSLRFHKISRKSPNIGVATIVPDEEGVVEGIIYEVTMSAIANLDQFEHYPTDYDKVTLRVSYDEVEREILTYIAHPHKTRDGLRPLRSYLEHLLEARDILSEDYYNQLTKVETLD